MDTMRDVIGRLRPGHVVSWTSTVGLRSYSYVGYYAENNMIYTTATEFNTFVPQTMTLDEFANLIESEGVSLYLATKWEVQDVSAFTPPAPVPSPPVMKYGQPFVRDSVDEAVMLNRLIARED
jgi:hypothetical protein